MKLPPAQGKSYPFLEVAMVLAARLTLITVDGANTCAKSTLKRSGITAFSPWGLPWGLQPAIVRIGEQP
jgi:hypothetical protein